MKKALHGMITKNSNVMSDISTAARTGYDGLEIHTDKLWRYIEQGGTSEMLSRALQAHGIAAVAIDIIGNLEASDRESKNKLLEEAKILVDFAADIGAETIQLNAFEGLNALSVQENIQVVAQNIRSIAKIGAQRKIRFQYEGAAWTPIHSLRDCLHLLEEVGEDNVGLVIDFWHFWASRGASPEEIANLDKNIIYGVHCCGGTRPMQNEDGSIVWEDETIYRGYFPGEERMRNHLSIEEAVEGNEDNHNKHGAEILPVQEWMAAVVSTGFDGWVSGEFLHHGLWEGDNEENAKIMKEALDRYIT